MSTTAQEIESRIDIVELVRDYVPLKKAGANWKGISPFKAEKTPSFVVSPAKQIAYCFATNQGGGPIRFLMLVERIEFKEALQILAKRAGVTLNTDVYKEQGKNTTQILDIHTIAANTWNKNLFQPSNREILNYLLERGLTEETINLWKIGYSSEPRDLIQILKAKEFEHDAIFRDSGIFVSEFRDRFFERITFPISSYRGDVVAFTGRTIKTHGKIAKYVNSPETDIFHKSSILFGLDRAKQSIMKKKRVIVVEGQMDVIALHQAEFSETIGISGTAFTDTHIRMLRRITNQIYLCLDSDDAGVRATFSCIASLTNKDLDIYVIDLGDKKDPDEIVSSGEDFEKYVSSAQTVVSYYLSHASRRHDMTTVQGKKSLIQEVLAYVASVISSLEVEMYMQEISDHLNISLQVLYSEYNKARRKTSGSNTDQEANELENKKSYSSFDYLAMFLLFAKDVDSFCEHFVFDKKILADTDGTQLLLQVLDSSEIPQEQRDILQFYFSEKFGSLESTDIEREFLLRMKQVHKDIFNAHKSSFGDSLEGLMKLQDFQKQARKANIL